MSIPNDSFFFVVASNARKCGNHILVVSALNSMFCALKLTVKNRSAARKPSPQNPIYSTALKKNILSTRVAFLEKRTWKTRLGATRHLCMFRKLLSNQHTRKKSQRSYILYL